MPVVALSWQQAGWLALGLVVLGAAAARTPWRRARAVAPFVTEAGIIAGLYAVWQFAGSLARTGAGGAVQRGRWILQAEHDVHLPSELDVQRALLPHPWLAQAADVYYATMHFTGLFAFLLWLFVRHRDRYRPVRTTLALLTLACLLVALVPVAPPRLIPGAGFVDVAARYGQSVYAALPDADQYSAMPSVHVAWAVLIGLAVVRISTSPWRWLVPVHTVLTILIVVATGNHYWADGIVSVLLLAACLAGQHAASRLLRRGRTRAPARHDQLEGATTT